MMEKRKVWWIEATTGCSCCAYQNFNRGFYFNKEEPQAIIDKWSKGINNPLTSQYAEYGRYYLREGEAEVLPDGRIIMGDKVFGPEENVEYPSTLEYFKRYYYDYI